MDSVQRQIIRLTADAFWVIVSIIFIFEFKGTSFYECVGIGFLGLFELVEMIKIAGELKQALDDRKLSILRDMMES